MRLPLIQTERCTLRPWTREDVDGLHALWAAPEVRRYLWDDAIISRETVEQIVDSHLVTAEHYGIGYWTISLPQLTGFCGLSMTAPTSS
jgi:ribosomal-protein-alanine N-acetyltransferase